MTDYDEEYQKSWDGGYLHYFVQKSRDVENERFLTVIEEEAQARSRA